MCVFVCMWIFWDWKITVYNEFLSENLTVSLKKYSFTTTWIKTLYMLESLSISQNKCHLHAIKNIDRLYVSSGCIAQTSTAWLRYYGNLLVHIHYCVLLILFKIYTSRYFYISSVNLPWHVLDQKNCDLYVCYFKV